MKWFIISLVLSLSLFSVSCSVVERLYGANTPETQTTGGDIQVAYSPSTDQVTVTARQPSNPDEAASVSFEILPYQYTTIPLENRVIKVTATTGSSREDKFAGLGLKLDSYKPFTYVGAAMCVVGVVLTVAAFRVPLIPKMAGPIIFIGGGATAYMATAIPEYGHYALIICLIGFVAWYYHQSAAKKDPQQFTRTKTA